MRALRTRRRALHRRARSRRRRTSCKGKTEQDALIAYLQDLGTRAEEREVSHGHLHRSSAASSPCVALRRVPRHRRLGLSGRRASALRRRGARAVRAARRRAATGAGRRHGRRAMSDFTAEFWNLYVIVVTLVSHRRAAACCCYVTGRKRVQRAGGADGREHHRPRLGRGPRRVQQPAAALVDVAVLITIVFALGLPRRCIPGLGSFAGVLGWTSAGAVRRARSTTADATVRAAVRQVPRRWTSKQVAADPAGARRWASACSSTTARSATAPTPAARAASRT